MRKKMTSFRLSLREIELLAEVARRESVTKTAVVREAIYAKARAFGLLDGEREKEVKNANKK
jgi:predicted DNA-binding protein